MLALARRAIAATRGNPGWALAILGLAVHLWASRGYDYFRDEMYFIVEGRVVVAAPSPVTLGPGSFFGEMALITGEPRSATVSAAAAVSLLSLHASDFQMLCGSSPELAEIIRQTALERRQAIRTS